MCAISRSSHHFPKTTWAISFRNRPNCACSRANTSFSTVVWRSPNASARILLGADAFVNARAIVDCRVMRLEYELPRNHVGCDARSSAISQRACDGVEGQPSWFSDIAGISRNRVRHEFLIVDDPRSQRRFPEIATFEDRFPIVRLVDGTLLAHPSTRELAIAVNLQTKPSSGTYDAIVIGGVPRDSLRRCTVRRRVCTRPREDGYDSLHDARRRTQFGSRFRAKLVERSRSESQNVRCHLHDFILFRGRTRSFAPAPHDISPDYGALYLGHSGDSPATNSNRNAISCAVPERRCSS